ncbi:MAG: signal peptide peptidase SppA [Candidatus Methanomarinus sp.]|uniref:Signal peptide peptidase SppA n=1 Tax=Candidatus Methanomarinus sp. TaxID=3386244 RepID=A0AC61SC96_9EURY|nr:protease-4 [ANME-2 cluster archaeon]TKY92307.1 MAG: signal peptide peptidase SppA [ANME-2 cluster archaeon]
MYSDETDQQVPKRRFLTLRSGLLYLFIVLILLVIITGSLLVIFGDFNGLSVDSDKVSVIHIQGVMITGNLPGGFGYATSEEICKCIRNAADDNNVKAIVLRINSGGGTPAAAQEITNEIKKAKEKKPIVVSMGDVAASGGYYISAPTDFIVANPDTITGSIGVIWVFENRSAYYKEEGIEFYVAKSGKFKDMGRDWTGLSDDEKQYSDEIVMETYQRFVDEVAIGRDLSVSEVKDLADGRIYTGSKAIELGLVDKTGNLYDAIDIAAELGNIEGEPDVDYENKPTLSKLLFGSSNEMNSQVEGLLRYFYDSPFGRIEI